MANKKITNKYKYKIPKGYRLMMNGEIIKIGDSFWGYEPNLYGGKIKYTWMQVSQNSWVYGRKFTTDAFSTFITKIIKKKYNKNQENKIISRLKSQRAFNEDSALKVKKDFELYFTLFLDKKIGNIGDRFFYNKNYE